MLQISVYLLSVCFNYCVIRGLNAAKSGSFFHHEAEQTREDRRDGPRWVPRIRVEVCDGQT